MTYLSRSEYITQRTVSLAEWAGRRRGRPVRSSNTDPPKYREPCLKVIRGAAPDQLDWTELAETEDWERGQVEGEQLAVGVDWLTVYSWGGSLRPNIAELLTEARAAVDEGEQVVVRLAGEEYAVQSRGQKPVFRWLLKGPSATLAIRAPSEKFLGADQMTAMVEFRSPTLWRRGATQALETWQAAVESLFERRPAKWTVSRLDLAVDVRCKRLPDDGHLMARAQCQTFESGSGDQTWTASTYGGMGALSTGWRWGTGDVVVRCYRKDREIQTSGKAWVRELWGGWQGEAWRLEVQLRGGVLRELATDNGSMKGATPQRWLEESGSIWSAFVGGQGAWCSVRARPKETWGQFIAWWKGRGRNLDSNKSRWPVHPWWAPFVEAKHGGEKVGVVRRPRHLPKWAEDEWGPPVGRVFVSTYRPGGRPRKRTRPPASSREAPPRGTSQTLRDRSCQQEALTLARLPQVCGRDFAAAAGAVARCVALAGRETTWAHLDRLVNDDAVNRATDRVVFGSALDALAHRIQAPQSADTLYLLRAPDERPPGRRLQHAATVGHA